MAESEVTGEIKDEPGGLRVLRGFSSDEEPADQGSAPEDEMALEEEPAPEVEIDLQALAGKVFALFRQELRVERERLVRTRPW